MSRVADHGNSAPQPVRHLSFEGLWIIVGVLSSIEINLYYLRRFFSALEVFFSKRYALYKSTFYLLIYLLTCCYRQDLSLARGDAEQQTMTSVDNRDSTATDVYDDQQHHPVPPQSEQGQEQTTGGVEEQERVGLQEDAAAEGSTHLLLAGEADEAVAQTAAAAKIVAGVHGMKTRRSPTVVLPGQRTVDGQQENDAAREVTEVCSDERAAVSGEEREIEVEDVQQKTEDEEEQPGNELKMEASEAAGKQEDGDDTRRGKDVDW